MTSLLSSLGDRLLASIGGDAAAAPSSSRQGSLSMPAQTATTGELAAANTRFSEPFSPGFLEGPVWPVEWWLLSSFQVTLSGQLVVGIALDLTQENDRLPVTLELQQHGRPVWSQNLDLQLVPELGTDKQHFNFQIGVFVDLTNPLRYVAGAQPQFVISGLVPVYKPAGPTFEEEALERLDQVLSALEGQGVTLEEIEGSAESISQGTEEVSERVAEAVAELEAAGVTQEEIVTVLEQIATNTEAEEEP